MEMKKQLLGGILLLQSLFSLAQNTVVVANEKMNVVYIGVDNPMEIETIKGGVVSVDNGSIEQQGEEYIWRPLHTGLAKLTIAHASGETETFPFRVKRIPTPVAKLGKDDGWYRAEFSVAAMNGVLAVQENFDFEVKCEVVSYEVTVAKKRERPETAINIGAMPVGEAARLIQRIDFGDVIYYEKIKALCPGDTHPRTLNDMMWRIK